MKNLYLFVLGVLLWGTVYSQQIQQVALENYYEVERPKHAYYKDVNNLLNKYLGTWVYNQDGHYFKVTFYKQTYFRETPPQNTKVTIFSDRIYGHYQYKRNGIEIYNVTSDENLNSLSGPFFSNNFLLSFTEPSSSPCGRPIFSNLFLEYNQVNGEEQLQWHREDKSTSPTCWLGQEEDNTPLQTPVNMVLTKID